jgi:soluble lytic murein transglycosylase-like protein
MPGVGRFHRLALTCCLAAGLGLLAGSQSASAYTVQPGDNVWTIAHRYGIPLDEVVARNHLANPNRIYPGQQLDLAGLEKPVRPVIVSGTQPAPAPPPAITHEQARAILTAAAQRHGVRPSFVLAVAWWESGWNQSAVSPAGAVGLMQIEPDTEQWAAPALVGHRVDLRDAGSNADLGAALLANYLQSFGSADLALAAYYQGPTAAKKYGIYPASRQYVDGITALRNRFEAGG